MRRIVFAWFGVFCCMALIYAISDQSIAGPPGGGLFEKPSHVFEYSFFSLLCINACIQSVGLKKAGPAIAAGVLLAIAFAISDEWHQSWVPLRHSDLNDIFADVLGAAMTGLLCSRLLMIQPPTWLRALAWLPGLIVFFVILLPLVELGFVITLFRKLGFLYGMAWVFGTAILGLQILWDFFRKNFSPIPRGGEILNPITALLDRGLLFLAAILLIIPGVLTDAAGLLLCLTPLRRAILEMLSFLFMEKIQQTMSTPSKGSFWSVKM